MTRLAFTPGQVAEMTVLKRRGLSLEAIGKRFGCSAPSVAKLLRSMAADTSRRAALTPEQKEDVVRRYRSGETMGALAEAYNVSRQPIKKVLREAGVPLRSISEAMTGRAAHNKREFSADELNTIKRMWEDEQLTGGEIAAHFGPGSSGPIFRAIKEHGYVKESPKRQRSRLDREEQERFAALAQRGLLERAQDLHRQGFSFTEIAKVLEVPHQLLRHELTQLGLTNFGASLPLDFRKAVLKRYGRRKGDRIADLVRKFGVSTPTTVCKFLKSRGVDTTYSFNFGDDDLGRMRELYNQGMGTTEIAYLLSAERNEHIYDWVVRDALTRAGGVLVGYTAAVQHDSPHAGPVRLRGAWEKDVAVYLDRLADRREIQGWQYATLRIPYQHDGRKRTYTPDFVVTHRSGGTEIWEVKGKWFSGTEEKLEAARRAGYLVKVIDEEGIKEVWDEVLDRWDWNWM